MAIQNEHCVACEGYHQPSVKTGYETIVAQRTGDIFAFTAKKPGTVREVTATGIIVDYDDGETQGFLIGRRYGTAAGLTIPHEIVTPLNVGDKFGVGDAIVYNTGFFEKDFFDPKKISYKGSMEVPTVLWESSDTHEDSSAITRSLSDKLKTKITKVKYVQLNFDQSISNLIKPGTEVASDSVLCLIQDAVTANNKLFDEKSIETLKAFSAHSPRAHVKGILERIEVYYHGEREDMSDSLKELTEWTDRVMKKRALSAGKKAFTGQVDNGFRIEGKPIPVDSLAIKFYITTVIKAGSGDKSVFANQLKTVIGNVIDGEMTTESGEPIEAVFGGKSIEARIVNSPFTIGTTATLLRVIAKQACEIYRGKRK